MADPEQQRSGNTSADGLGRIAPAALPPEPPWASTDYTPLGVVDAFRTTRYAAPSTSKPTRSLCTTRPRIRPSLVPEYRRAPGMGNGRPSPVPLVVALQPAGHADGSRRRSVYRWKAVLLAGKGGSGKSTTALACALAGFGYLGDDYCAVDPRDRSIHMVYRSAKIFPPAVEMLPALKPRIVSRGQLPLEKDIVVFDDSDVRLVRSATLSAILLPRVGTERVSTIYPAARAEATKAILPTTFMQLMGGTPVTAGLIMQLTRDVPAFHLELGTDLETVTDAIVGLLKSTECLRL